MPASRRPAPTITTTFHAYFKTINTNNNNGKNNSSHKNVQKWNILYTNIRGIKSKLTSLRQSLTENLPHLFLLTETQLRSNTGISADGYTFFGRKREGKIGGGVGICVRNDIRPSIAAHISERNLEIIWVSHHSLSELITANKKLGQTKMKLRER